MRACCHHPPVILQWATSRWLRWKMPPGRKRIYLTFDDGPDPSTTGAIMEILSRHQAKATFFLSGQQAVSHPRWVQSLSDHGHQLGNHGFEHLSGWKTSTSRYVKNTRDAAGVIPGKLFRPPYGRICPGQIVALRKRGWSIIMWSVFTPDYRQHPGHERIWSDIGHRLSDGDIILMHDKRQSASNTLPLLERLLSHYSARGYAFHGLPGHP